MRRTGRWTTWGFAALAGLGVTTGAAWADALPQTVLGANGALLNTSVVVNSMANGNPQYPLSFSFGTGGGFAASVDGYNTTVWCVDSEEDIYFPTTYNADLVSTAKLTGTNLTNYVKYGNVTGVYGVSGNTNGWAMDLGSDNNATARFKMAAYLVSQYKNYPTGPPNDQYDKDIQTAIWEITYNYSISSSLTFAAVQGGVPSGEQAAVANWISTAKTFVDNANNASYFNNFALLSGNVNSSGQMSGTGYQTYIVQMRSVPEPSTWLALLAGLGLITFVKLRFVCLRHPR